METLRNVAKTIQKCENERREKYLDRAGDIRCYARI